MEYTRQPISFDPTKYILEVGRRGLDLSEGMRAHRGLKDVDALKRRYASEYVDRPSRPLREDCILQNIRSTS
jgi:hypothetical protein